MSDEKLSLEKKEMSAYYALIAARDQYTNAEESAWGEMDDSFLQMVADHPAVIAAKAEADAKYALFLQAIENRVLAAQRAAAQKETT